jgi:hypothetical protein
MVLANQNAKLTGPDQGFLVSRLVLSEALGTRLLALKKMNFTYRVSQKKVLRFDS